MTLVKCFSMDKSFFVKSMRTKYDVGHLPIRTFPGCLTHSTVWTRPWQLQYASKFSPKSPPWSETDILGWLKVSSLMKADLSYCQTRVVSMCSPHLTKSSQHNCQTWNPTSCSGWKIVTSSEYELVISAFKASVHFVRIIWLETVDGQRWTHSNVDSNFKQT